MTRTEAAARRQLIQRMARAQRQAYRVAMRLRRIAKREGNALAIGKVLFAVRG